MPVAIFPDGAWLDLASWEANAARAGVCGRFPSGSGPTGPAPVPPQRWRPVAPRRRLRASQPPCREPIHRR
jgi:hypothetical protein